MGAAAVKPKSLAELFRNCEVTFAGSKSAGWKDDVSFHPSLSLPMPPEPGVASSAPAQQQGAATACRGKFWRNQNRDRGQYTLVVDDGGEAARLRLGWDRWDEEVLILKEKGRIVRFEGGVGSAGGARVLSRRDVRCLWVGAGRQGTRERGRCSGRRARRRGRVARDPCRVLVLLLIVRRGPFCSTPYIFLVLLPSEQSTR